MRKKTKNLIFYGIGAIIVIGIIFLTAAGGNEEGNTHSSDYSASILSAQENSFNFGTISMEKGEVSYKFELKNEGEETVKIEKVYTSCMCTTAVLTDKASGKLGKFGMPGHGFSSRTGIEVRPGESIFVEAVFDPAAHGPSGVGLAKRSIYLETNSEKSSKVELNFTAMVTR